VFDRPSDRDRIAQAATDRHLPFTGIWLDAAPDVLWHRVDQRRGGPSDATVDILSRQLQKDVGEIAWHRLDAASDLTKIISDILALQSR
jgi:predicted kinase